MKFMDEEISGYLGQILQRIDSYHNEIYHFPDNYEKDIYYDMPLGMYSKLTGEGIIKAIFGSTSTYDHHSMGINVIPGGKPGTCQRDLVVAIGYRDGVEKRIFQAMEHISVKCRSETQNVIFIALKWDFSIWLEHVHAFRMNQVKVYLCIPSLGHSRIC